MRKTTSLTIKGIITLLIAMSGGYVWHLVRSDPTIEKLLTENRDLKQAITHLSEETQIGYAKVLSQEVRDGQLRTKLLFVETKPHEPQNPVLKKEFEIEGDIAHFDALIVTFGQQLVMDGQDRAIYLWRRVYGESTPPEAAESIQAAGSAPKRYSQISERLSLEDRNLFWSEIWDLANDPNRLENLGVRAVYGNVVYNKLQPGVIYIFKISSTGALYLEVIPDF